MKASEALKDSKYACGNCGEPKHELFKHEEGIVVVCCNCGNESKIIVTQPKINIEWMDNQDGILAVF